MRNPGLRPPVFREARKACTAHLMLLLSTVRFTTEGSSVEPTALIDGGESTKSGTRVEPSAFAESHSACH